MNPLYVLKLGGSVITAKREAKPIIKRDEIIRIAKEVKGARKANFFDIVLVHGVGSFGHGLAKKYRLWEGIRSKPQVQAFSKTQVQTITLNNSLLEVFTSVGLPVIAINPTTAIVQNDAKLKTFDIRAVKHFLKEHFIPVLYGTVVPDEKLIGSICSGDTMVTYISKELKPSRAIFATDVDGIYTQDPNRSKKAQLISEITNRNYKEVVKGTQGSASKIDVGGGMRGKLEEIKLLAPGVETWIINGEKRNRIRRSLSKQKVIGTKILFS
jgi:isopentenyl phosphate kinase